MLILLGWQVREGFSLILKKTLKTYMLGAWEGRQKIKLGLMVYSSFFLWVKKGH